jgi:hydroxymethylpyrimidine/phosphomethylpyrimidine kinase
VLEACRLAKAWLTRAIAAAPGVGGGQGAVDHLTPLTEAEHE